MCIYIFNIYTYTAIDYAIVPKTHQKTHAQTQQQN